MKHPRGLDAGASLGGIILVEGDISASSGEFYTLHVAVTWLADEDAKNIRETRFIEDSAKLRHESCVRGRGEVNFICIVALRPLADCDTGGDEAVDEWLDGGADVDVELDGDGDGADSYEALFIADFEVRVEHLDSEVVVDIVA